VRAGCRDSLSIGTARAAMLKVCVMWQCSTCTESHGDSFDTCWKCGTSSTGDRNPNFHISEPATAQDQGADSPAEATCLPVMQLPIVTYFAIPPCIWLDIVIMVQNEPFFPDRLQPDFRISPTAIILWSVAMLLVEIPIFCVFIRGIFLRLIRRQIGEGWWSDVVWSVSTFRLPASFHHKYRWFVFVYYASIVAYVVVPLGFFFGLLIAGH
jgi:hypothetical protein